MTPRRGLDGLPPQADTPTSGQPEVNHSKKEMGFVFIKQPTTFVYKLIQIPITSMITNSRVFFRERTTLFFTVLLFRKEKVIKLVQQSVL